MSENIVCKECKWNKYPECLGSLINGIPMAIDELSKGFTCGQKDKDVAYNQILYKNPIETMQEEIINLKERITEIEKI